MKKIIIGILVFCVCAVVLVVAGRNFIVKTAVVKGIEALTGLKIEIQKVDIGLLKPTVEISYLKVYNPANFTDRLMADIPKVYVKYEPGGLLKSQVHLQEVKIEIDQLCAVLNEQGKLNFNSLALLMPKPDGGKSPETKIDELSLKIGKVAYKGYLPAVGTKAMEFNPGIDETFKDVTDPSKLANDILKKILARIGIADFAKFDIGQAAGLKEKVTETLKGVESSAQEMINKTKEDLKNIF